jgi:hypothetical protein
MKKITISKVCNEKCVIVFKSEWKNKPKIKSWDVMGIRIENGSMNELHRMIVTGDNYTKIYDNYQNKINGIGCSIKIPDTNNIKILMSLNVSKGTIVYGSYQHANQNVTENQSKKYDISYNGMGRVFLFDKNVKNKYDNTPGVIINT